MFVDRVIVKLKAGNGGNGIVSFRREAHVPLGGPNGGDGGNGGSIIFEVDTNKSTLLDLRYNKKIIAKNGENGKSKKMHGASGEDIIIKVPQGTIIKDATTHDMIADLTKVDQRAIVCKGGKGGRGNIHFATPTRTAPEIAENGEPGEFRTLRLELKVLADVGLVGFPSVGKSTLLSVVTKAKPKIAAYEFTTLTPNLGMVVLPDGRDFSMADLPGLIEGASKGVGLGIQFLRHVERTKVILHLVSMDPNNGRDAYEDYETIRKELAGYTKDLTTKKEIIVATQMDIPGSEEKFAEFKKKLGDKTVYPISSVTHKGVSELMGKTADLVEEVAKEEAEKPAEIKVAEKEYVYKKPEDEGFKVERTGEHSFVVTGNKLERLVQRTNLDHTDVIMLLARKLNRLGVDEALSENGAVTGDDVSIADFTFEFVD